MLDRYEGDTKVRKARVLICVGVHSLGNAGLHSMWGGVSTKWNSRIALVIGEPSIKKSLVPKESVATIVCLHWVWVSKAPFCPISNM